MGIMDGLKHLTHCRVCGFPQVDGRCLHERLQMTPQQWQAHRKAEAAKAARREAIGRHDTPDQR